MRYFESFKQEILTYLKNHSRRSTAKHFNVNPITIRKWVDPEYKIKHNEQTSKSLKRRLHDPKYKKIYQKQCRDNLRNRYHINPEYKHKTITAIKNRIKYRPKRLKDNYTYQDKQQTKKLFDNKCAICNSTDDLCIDHWYPYSKGYTLTRTNAVLMCRSCNSKKGNKLPIEFFSEDTVSRIEKILNQ